MRLCPRRRDGDADKSSQGRLRRRDAFAAAEPQGEGRVLAGGDVQGADVAVDGRARSDWGCRHLRGKGVGQGGGDGGGGRRGGGQGGDGNGGQDGGQSGCKSGGKNGGCPDRGLAAPTRVEDEYRGGAGAVQADGDDGGQRGASPRRRRRRRPRSRRRVHGPPEGVRHRAPRRVARLDEGRPRGGGEGRGDGRDDSTRVL
mmetsp:Transcript_7389/g.29140  ORF Transcript_7389/g.29140 Transcript_7389/m.29140 type:complete len:200 (-) Transcript_7389:908-1507(-)